MKIYIAHSNSYDYQTKLYEPIRESPLNTEHEFFLPHEKGGAQNTKEMMKEYDLVIAEVSEPSTGEGIELGRADAFDIPIVCLYEKEKKISSSLRYVTETFLEYTTPEEMIEKIRQAISTIK